MDVVDVFVYVVVLNLAVEYFPRVLTESFTMSLLTAVLLKAVLELVLIAEHAVGAHYKKAPTWWSKALGILALVLVAVGSKLALLWVIDLVFDGDVSLGSFWSVTAVVIALLVARSAVRNLLFWEQTERQMHTAQGEEFRDQA